MRFRKGWSQETDNEIMGKRTVLSCVRHQCNHVFTSRPCTKIAAEQEWKYQKQADSHDAYRAHLHVQCNWLSLETPWMNQDVQRPSWFYRYEKSDLFIEYDVCKTPKPSCLKYFADRHNYRHMKGLRCTCACRVNIYTTCIILYYTAWVPHV